MQHPLGVQPTHIADLFGHNDDVRTKGLGLMFKISDEAILNILGYLEAKDLIILQSVSKALYCFCNHEELWKALALENLPDNQWTYQGTWQDTYLAHKVPNYKLGTRRFRPVSHFYSDLLHQSWLCANLDVDPTWLEVENINRRSGLSVEDFKAEYERPNRPVILTDVVSKWPAIKKWNRFYLKKVFKNKSVIVGDAPMSFEAYLTYADNQKDELPLYLFDKTFTKTAPELANDYSVPDHFSEDLFSVLGEERPDYRWLIAGPYKSGSTWHQDPNETCAWNAVVAGSKRWILYPPGTPPPGVRPSADGADVACPVSLMEWYLSFYQYKDAAGVVPLECTVNAGEVLFVPRGWWHAVLNLSESVAVTQNYVCSSNLEKVLAFIGSEHADVLVSGVRTEEEKLTLHDRFVKALKEKRPEVLERLEQEREEKRLKAEADSKLASCFKLDTAEPRSFSFFNNNGGATTEEAPPPTTDKSAKGGFSFQFNV